MHFNEILGNNQVKEYLNNSIVNNNYLHSYLFVGTSGIGKKLIAEEFSRKILCLETAEDNCKCKSCLCFNGNNHPDYKVINESGETIKVDTIRELTKKVYEKPIISNHKVYIINEADKMTQEAQNSLLKTLEEPPEFTTIILISSNENSILNTIKSRCMKLGFNNIADNSLQEYAKSNLSYNHLTNAMIKAWGGSIGKAITLNENEDLYTKIEQFLDSIPSMNQIEICRLGKILYEKELIKEILDFVIVCMYENSTKDTRYLDCMKDVTTAIEHLNYNANFDMTLDNMLLKIAEKFDK